MKTKRFAAAVASLGIIASMAAIVPMSAGAAYSVENQATGGTPTFKKYLVLESDAAVPNVSTTFAIEPVDPPATPVDSINAFKGETGVVFKNSTGVTVGTDGKATVSFSSVDTASAIKDTNANTEDDTVVFADTVDNNEKFVTKSITLDFSAVKFKEPGIYCYKITETIPEASVVTNVNASNEYLYLVYVEDNAGKLEVKSYTLQEGVAAPEIETNTDDTVDPPAITKRNTKKLKGVTNRYSSHNLEFTKTVQGNQGSRDKYFKFTVKLINPAAGETGHVDVADNSIFIIDDNISSYDAAPEVNAATVYTAADMAAANTVHVGEDSSKYVTYSELAEGKAFYLHSGQDIDILGIPAGLGYEIEEVKEDYTPSVVAKTGTNLDSNGVVEAETPYKITDSKLEADAIVNFTNTKGGVIPTGVIMSVAGSAGIVAVGAAGVACGLFMKKKKSDEE